MVTPRKGDSVRYEGRAWIVQSVGRLEDSDGAWATLARWGDARSEVVVPRREWHLLVSVPPWAPGERVK